MDGATSFFGIAVFFVVDAVAFQCAPLLMISIVLNASECITFYPFLWFSSEIPMNARSFVLFRICCITKVTKPFYIKNTLHKFLSISFFRTRSVSFRFSLSLSLFHSIHWRVGFIYIVPTPLIFIAFSLWLYVIHIFTQYNIFVCVYSVCSIGHYAVVLSIFHCWRSSLFFP